MVTMSKYLGWSTTLSAKDIPFSTVGESLSAGVLHTNLFNLLLVRRVTEEGVVEARRIGTPPSCSPVHLCRVRSSSWPALVTKVTNLTRTVFAVRVGFPSSAPTGLAELKSLEKAKRLRNQDLVTTNLLVVKDQSDLSLQTHLSIRQIAVEFFLTEVLYSDLFDGKGGPWSQNHLLQNNLENPVDLACVHTHSFAPPVLISRVD
jgi:hypothetical protein